MAFPAPTETAICHLLSELERSEIETAALTREIRSSSTPADRRAQAIERRDELQEQWVSIIVELDALGHVAQP